MIVDENAGEERKGLMQSWLAWVMIIMLKMLMLALYDEHNSCKEHERRRLAFFSACYQKNHSGPGVLMVVKALLWSLVSFLCCRYLLMSAYF